jgi:hypothetical protein
VPFVIAIQPALLTAVQEHPFGVITRTLPAPPLFPAERPCAPREYAQLLTTVIVIVLDQEETSVGWEMHRARAFTVYVPPVLQECDAEVLVLHVEDVPSPQSKLYSRVWPKFELAPLTQYP